MGDTLNLGGTEGQLAEIACGLNGSRWDLQVCCLKAEGPIRSRLEAACIRPWSCGPKSLRSPRLVDAVWSLSRYLRWQKVRLLHSFDFYSNIIGVFAGRLAGMPIIIASQRDLGNLRPRFQQFLQRSVLRAANYILVNSEAVAERVRSYSGLLGKRVVLIPNGVDTARFSPGLRSSDCSERSITIGTLANLRPEKGIPDFVRAAALIRERNPDVRFLIWGDGPIRNQLKSLISELKLENSVELCGATTEPDLALRKLNIFVLPSLSEACSNGLLEAMATGLPVVATRVGGNLGIVEDGCTGLLVPPGDPMALAQAVSHLVEERHVAAQFGIRARERVLAEFSIQRMLERIEAFYREAIARSMD